MTRYGILLFLLSVYAMLAGVCFLMPEGGITVGPCTLGFPSPAEMRSSLVPDKSPQPAPDPEQLIRERMASIRNAEQRRFDEYFESNPARLHFPDGDISMFDPFFRSLDNVIHAAKGIGDGYEGWNSLYKNPDDGAYYLLVRKMDTDPEKFNRICNVLSEYSMPMDYSTGMDEFFREHMKVILSENALQDLQKI